MILVTGATGHIGNVLVRKLVSAGRRVRALIWRGEDTLALQGLDVEMVEGDLLEPESLKPAFDGVKQVFHLAGLISILPGADLLLQRVNVEGTRNMISAAQRADVERFVYTSSIHALEDRPAGVVIDEDVPFIRGGAPDGYSRSRGPTLL